MARTRNRLTGMAIGFAAALAMLTLGTPAVAGTAQKTPKQAPFSMAAADAAGSSAWKPPTDLVEETDRYVVRADLPGVSASEVEVLVERGRLVLRGERRREGPSSDEAYLRVERPDGRFLVQIALPTSVDQQRIQANHSNGVLEVVLPKRHDEPPGRIEVAASA